ncbi:hypothetical protein ACN5YO_004588 [Vibrio parahaemolyticus]|nr:hypothetical protein [Vibrio parahaemolyticus]MCF9080072.1 hypothetical protein [Vibrio parahaemolyticus]
MSAEPLKALYEKSNVFEFLTRMSLLVLKPKIAIDEDLTIAPLRSEKGVLRFGLWDLYLSASLMLVFTVLIDILFGTSYVSFLETLKQEILIPLEFGYYGFWYTFIFFIISMVVCSFLKVARKQPHINVVKQSCILMSQYARVYALVMFLFYSIAMKMLHTMVTELTKFDNLFQNDLLLSDVIAGVFIYLYFRCLINPIRHYLNIVKYRIIVFPIVIFMTILPMLFSGVIPTPSKHAAENVPIEKVLKKSYEEKYCK